MIKQVLVLLLLFFCAPVVNAEEDNILAEVEGSARAWLELIDSGKYKEGWETSSPLFKTKTPEPEWVKSITGIRAPRGAVNARYLATAGSTKTLSGFPEDDYVVLQFYTTFATKGLALETITLAKAPDEAWRVAEYVIK
ncbi:DUF4019 domain-containing protein [Nitrosomonas sp. Nm166]|uniref:DUF4019 domain-containing protein n=1 Tax=Nitrosomonas sp. Nm166 TaxID=1881054 RepID=UPI0008E1CAF3|nr:DUF4019 domain-containing protein [Nitrosomonas sp. Nm166]SFE31980.1 Protein of unknown function [Nitrosomonas sp. Nm166]